MLAYQSTHGKKPVRTREIAFFALGPQHSETFSRVAEVKVVQNSNITVTIHNSLI